MIIALAQKERCRLEAWLQLMRIRFQIQEGKSKGREVVDLTGED